MALAWFMLGVFAVIGGALVVVGGAQVLAWLDETHPKRGAK